MSALEMTAIERNNPVSVLEKAARESIEDDRNAFISTIKYFLVPGSFTLEMGRMRNLSPIKKKVGYVVAIAGDVSKLAYWGAIVANIWNNYGN